MPPLLRLSRRPPYPSTATLGDLEFRRRLTRVALLLAAVVAAGTVGYMLLERWSLLDAFYMTVITISTVGFTEVHPLSGAGHLFTIGLIFGGVSAAAYAVGTIGEHVIGGQLSGTLRRRRMQQEIDQIEGHYIVCGFGRVGRQVVENLQHRQAPVVVVEPDDAAYPESEAGPPRIRGDATDDRALREAGIERAAGLVAAAGDDAINIVISLSARALNPGLIIVARASHPEAEDKLRRAGATHVISPYRIGGQRMVSQLLHPRITDFLDVVMQRGEIELWLEEISIQPNGPAKGKTLADSKIAGPAGVNVLALARPGGKMVTNPPADLRLAVGDVLIALGTPDQLAIARQQAGQPEHRSRVPSS